MDQWIRLPAEFIRDPSDLEKLREPLAGFFLCSLKLEATKKDENECRILCSLKSAVETLKRKKRDEVVGGLEVIMLIMDTLSLLHTRTQKDPSMAIGIGESLMRVLSGSISVLGGRDTMVGLLKGVRLKPLSVMTLMKLARNMAYFLGVVSGLTVEPELMRNLFYVISFPWFSEEVQSSDRYYMLHKELTERWKSISKSQVGEVKELLVSAVAIFPKGSGSGRGSRKLDAVFSGEHGKRVLELSLANNDARIQEGALRALPLFGLGPQRPSSFANILDILSRFIAPLLTGNTKRKDLVYSAIAGTLCTASGHSRTFLDKRGRPVSECGVCVGEEKGKKSGGMTFDPEVLNLALGEALDSLSHLHGSLHEKLAVCDLLSSMMNHVQFEGKPGGKNFHTLIAKSLWMLNAQSSDLREKYCACLKSAVQLEIGEELSEQIQVAIKDVGDDTHPDNMEWTIKYLGVIAAKSEGKKLRHSCMIKLMLLAVFYGANPESVKDALKMIIHAQGVESLHALYKRNMDEVWKFLVRELCDGVVGLLPFSEDSGIEEDVFQKVMEWVRECFHRASWLFSYEMTEWLRLGLKACIPWILLEVSRQASVLHGSVARILGTSRNRLIQDQFPHIVLKMALQQAPQDSVTTFLLQEGEGRAGGSNWELADYMTNCYQRCMFLLLVHWSVEEYGVGEMMKALSAMREMEEEEWSVHRFLRTRFMGAMIHFRQSFVQDLSVDDKRIALNSLILIIQTTKGPLLDGNTQKLATVLRAATEQEGLAREVSEVWLALARNLSTPILMEFLPTILVSIRPLLETKPISALCRFVFLDLNPSFCEAVEYKDVCAALSGLPGWEPIHHYVSKRSTHEPSVEETIGSCLRLLRYQVSDIKLLALKKLEHILRLKTLDSDSESISNLVQSLIETIQTCDDRDVRETVAKCLGDLGAIDPGRLGMDSAAPQGHGLVPDRRPPTLHFAGFGLGGTPSSLPNPEFAVETLRRMAEALNAASNPVQHDSCGCSLQEVLKCLELDGGNHEKENTEAGEIWRALSAEVQRALSPFLNSSYLGNRSTTEPQWPVYGRRGTSYGLWLSTWISQSIGTENKCPEAERFFASTMFMAEQDAGFANYILPHVILQGIMDGDAGFTNKVRTEVVGVLRSCENETLEYRHVAAQTIFGLLDVLKRWSKIYGKAKTEIFKQKVDRVNSFLSEIPTETVYEAAVSCQSYSRALMNFEAIMMKKQRPDAHTDFYQLQNPQGNGLFQKLYRSLMEGDGVEGAVAQIRTRREPTTQESILAYETSGDYHKALPYHESASRKCPESAGVQIGLMKCLLGLKEPKIVTQSMEGFLSSRTEADFSHAEWVELNSTRVEAAWKLQEWPKVEEISNQENLREKSWELTVGELLLILKKRSYSHLRNKLESSRRNLIGPLVAATMESGAYERAYPFICKLHVFAEIEQAAEALRTQEHDHLIQDWEKRLKLMQGSYGTVEQLLEIRRELVGFFPASEAMKRFKQMCWVQSARFNRTAGHLQVAWSSLVKAKDTKDVNILMDTYMEQAKYYWANNEKTEAIASIQKGLNHHFPHLLASSTPARNPHTPPTDMGSFVKAQTLLAQYASEASALEGREIKNLFEGLREHTKGLKAEAEQAYYRFGLFCDSQKGNESLDMTKKLIQIYSRVLESGSHYLYHCLPRILTLWLDFAQSREAGRREREEEEKGVQDQIRQVNELVKRELRKLPTHHLYSGFSQIISRLTHPSHSVYETLKDLMVELMQVYPSQCLWLSVGVYLSGEEEKRVKKKSLKFQRCAEIYEKMKQGRKEVAHLQRDTIALSRLFMDLARKTLKKNNTFSLRSVFPQFSKFFDQENAPRSKILIPLHSLMELEFVRSGWSVSHSAGHSQEFSSPTMSTKAVHIQSVQDSVQTLASQQVPKKIGLRGSDGKLYHIMCKSKDDLHKDKRLMEINQVVNSCLRQDTEARRRDLHVRTYSVIPLGSDGGLVEWVENLVPMRQALVQLMPEAMTQLEWSKCKAPTNSTAAEKLRVFKETFLPRHPDVMGRWLVEKFPEPCGWHAARLGFTRTTGVMSMVGFVLGLGDRHTENILLDLKSGDVFHVDFNLLFNTAEELQVPEIVPFRLTHNMVDGFGALGVEGPFRKTSEVVMGVLREKKTMVLTVLETFLHDPLVEWSRPVKAQQLDSEQRGLSLLPAHETKKAEQICRYIHDRLSGHIVTPKLHKKPGNRALALPLSVQSQVEQLIQLATSEVKLSQMYVGWCPFL